MRQEYTVQKRQTLQQMVLGKLTATFKSIKLEHSFFHIIFKNKLKWIKDLNVRPETVKLLEENIGRTFDDIYQSKILYDPPPRLLKIFLKSKQVGPD